MPTTIEKEQTKVTIVIPCYRCAEKIMAVINGVGKDIDHIIVVDDACPNQTGKFVEQQCTDPRVQVLRLQKNQGVGGATMAGFRQALELGSTIIVKIDGDGQMEPRLIPQFVKPIVSGEADFVKGNRFHYPESVISMPRVRLFGNAILSFFSKFSTGYWHIFDPNNGYIAIDCHVLNHLPLHQIHRRFFFESDLLFRLNLLGARVIDLPMRACYGDETSNLSPGKEIFRFGFLHCRNLLKRIAYNYFFRDFSIASVNLILGMVGIIFGFIFGSIHWRESIETGIPASAGTIMVAALPILGGIQLLLNFLSYDMSRKFNRRISDFLE